MSNEMRAYLFAQALAIRFPNGELLNNPDWENELSRSIRSGDLSLKTAHHHIDDPSMAKQKTPSDLAEKLILVTPNGAQDLRSNIFDDLYLIPYDDAVEINIVTPDKPAKPFSDIIQFADLSPEDVEEMYRVADMVDQMRSSGFKPGFLQKAKVVSPKITFARLSKKLMVPYPVWQKWHDSQPKIKPSGDYLQFADLSADVYHYLMERVSLLKAMKANNIPTETLHDYKAILIVEESSTRTNISIDHCVEQLGGSFDRYLISSSELESGRMISDTAKSLSRKANLIVAQINDHRRLVELAEAAKVPVINALTDDSPPFQVLADIFSFVQRFGSIEGQVIAWIGDNNSNANTWLQAAQILGFKVNICSRKGFKIMSSIAPEFYQVFETPVDAVADAIMVTTDVRCSKETQNVKGFTPCILDRKLVTAAPSGAMFMHWLPARHHVIDETQPVVALDAENRLYVQMALIEYIARGKRNDSTRFKFY